MIPAQLLDDVHAFVKNRNIHHVCLEIESQVYIMFADYPIPSDGFTKNTTDLLVLNTVEYPATAFDMFYTLGEIRLQNGTNPTGVTSVPKFGAKWLQWSIHPYQNNVWNPDKDDLSSFMSYVDQRFVNAD